METVDLSKLKLIILIGARLITLECLGHDVLHVDFFPRFWWFFIIMTYVVGLLALFWLFSFIVLVWFNG